MEQGRAGSREAATRAVVRRDAAAFLDDVRTMLAELEHAAGGRAQPRQLVADVLKGRPASECTLFAAVLVTVRQAPPDAILRFAQQLFARLLQERPSQPQASATAWPALVKESESQGPADTDQLRAMRALQLGDRVGLDRAIATSTAHLWSIMDVITILHAERERPVSVRRAVA